MSSMLRKLGSGLKDGELLHFTNSAHDALSFHRNVRSKR